MFVKNTPEPYMATPMPLSGANCHIYIRKMCLHNHKWCGLGFYSSCCILFLALKKSQVIKSTSTWSPLGVHMESTRTPPGVDTESLRSPHGLIRSLHRLQADPWGSVNYRNCLLYIYSSNLDKILSQKALDMRFFMVSKLIT